MGGCLHTHQTEWVSACISTRLNGHIKFDAYLIILIVTRKPHAPACMPASLSICLTAALPADLQLTCQSVWQSACILDCQRVGNTETPRSTFPTACLPARPLLAHLPDCAWLSTCPPICRSVYTRLLVYRATHLPCGKSVYIPVPDYIAKP